MRLYIITGLVSHVSLWQWDPPSWHIQQNFCCEFVFCCFGLLTISATPPRITNLHPVQWWVMITHHVAARVYFCLPLGWITCTTACRGLMKLGRAVLRLHKYLEEAETLRTWTKCHHKQRASKIEHGWAPITTNLADRVAHTSLGGDCHLGVCSFRFVPFYLLKTKLCFKAHTQSHVCCFLLNWYWNLKVTTLVRGWKQPMIVQFFGTKNRCRGSICRTVTCVKIHVFWVVLKNMILPIQKARSHAGSRTDFEANVEQYFLETFFRERNFCPEKLSRAKNVARF